LQLARQRLRPRPSEPVQQQGLQPLPRAWARGSVLLLRERLARLPQRGREPGLVQRQVPGQGLRPGERSWHWWSVPEPGRPASTVLPVQRQQVPTNRRPLQP
jgi:hypothetical protein